MSKKLVALFLAVATMVSLSACTETKKPEDLNLNNEAKPATQFTDDANQKVYALLDFKDTSEKENATKGLIVAPDSLDIYDENGKLAWS